MRIMKAHLVLLSFATLLSLFISIAYSDDAEMDDSQDLLARAKSLARQGNIDEAVEQYLIYYEKNPDQYEVLPQIAQLYKQNERFAEAIEFTEKYLVSQYPPLLDDGNFYDQCDRLLRLWKKTGAGKFTHFFGKDNGIELARAHYLARLADADTKPRMTIISQLILGDIEINDNNVDKARKHYLAAFDLVSPPADRWQEAVTKILWRRIIEHSWFNDAVTISKSHPNPDHLIRLGQWLRRQRRGFEMLDLYEDYLFYGYGRGRDDYSHRRKDKGLSSGIIDELVPLGQGESLIEQFSNTTVDPAETYRRHRNVGYLLFKMKRHEQGLTELKRYLATLDKALASDYQWVAELCEKAGMFNKAIEFYETALDTELDKQEASMDWMSCQMAYPYAPRQISSDGNIEVYLQEPWKTRFKNRILEKLGHLYMKKGRLADAEECFQEIVDSPGPRDKEKAQANLATIWERMGKENVFIEESKSKVLNDPCNVELRVQYSQTLSKAGKLSQAVEQCARAVELSGDDLSLRLKLAETLAKNKQNAEAIAEYEKVLYAGLKRVRNQFRRGKGGDDTQPSRVLSRLTTLCRRTGETEKLLEIYQHVLDRLDWPETTWQPGEYQLRRIIRDITRILDGKNQHNRAIELWLNYRRELGSHARDAISRMARNVNSQPIKQQLREIVMADPNDYWARFILGDILLEENRRDEATEVYVALLKDAPATEGMHHHLGRLFQRKLKRYDLALEAYTRDLGRFKKGSRDYAHRLDSIAEMHLMLGQKEKAARCYRQAMSCEASRQEHRRYQRGLFNATDGKEGRGKVDITSVEPIETLDTMRSLAESLRRKKDYAAAAQLYEKILETASTDVESMAHLGDAYERMGRRQEAIAINEKAFRIRAWTHGSDYGAASNLERLYRQTGADDKLIALFIQRRDYGAIKRFYAKREQPEEFKRYLLEQIKKNPRPRLRFHLGRYYLDNGNVTAATSVYEQLRKDLIDAEDKTIKKRDALNLAKAFEELGRFDEALAILASLDYAHDPDSNDWLGKQITRLYGKTGQFEKALEMCALRIKKHANNDSRMKEIVKQIAMLSQNYDGAAKALDTLMKTVKDEIPERKYRVFRGALRSSLASLPAGEPSATDLARIISLLKNGRSVQVPNDAPSFADFLKQLAHQADTIATQSFMGRHGRRRRPPKIKTETGSAFEILAEAIDGTNIPFEITQEGYWAFFESGDKSKRFNYAASGGIFCRLWELLRFSNRDSLYLGGRVSFAPEVKRNVASIQSLFTVLEAIDDRGRNIPIPEVGTRWDYSTGIEIPLSKQQPPAHSIETLRIKSAVAIGTKWVTFKIDRLDHTEPIIVEKDSVRIQVDPIRETAGRKPGWQIPIDIQRQGIAPKHQKITQLNDDIYFVTNDGKQHRFGGGGSFPSASHTKLVPRCRINAFDPATTSLFLRIPAAIEIVPFELTFKNIPIIDR